MKNSLLILCCICCVIFSATAQSGYVIVPESFDVNFNEDLENTNFFDLDAEMSNSATESLGFNWEIVNISMPEEWELFVSDKLIDYVSGITTNQQPLQLDPGETEVPYNVHLIPNQKIGCGSWEVLITLDTDPNVIIDTIEYVVTVNNDDCMLSGAPDWVQEVNMHMFPNPFTSSINITAEYQIEQISISDLQGNKVFNEKGNNITVIKPELNSGIYLIRLDFENGTSLMRRIIKI